MNDQGKTVVGGNGSDPTQTEREESSTDIGTDRLNTVTLAPSGFNGGSTAPLNPETTFVLNNTSYNYVRTLSETTAEAQVFLVVRNHDQFVLKRYYPFVKPKLDLVTKLRSIQHPDIIRVLDFGFIGGHYCEVMEFAAGGSLEARIPIRDINSLKRIIKETVNALSFCHEQGIIHRDVKPSNLFLRTANGEDVVLGDFGISSLLDPGAMLRRTSYFGTKVYAAPEQRQIIKGQMIVAKEMDYYSLGITVLHLYTGVLPFEGEDELSEWRQKSEGIFRIPDDVPDDLRTLIRGLTVPVSIHRWGCDEVQRWLKGESVTVYDEQEVLAYKTFKFGADDRGNKLVAHDPKELARLIEKHPDSGRKHLYRGTVGKWLEESKNHELFVEIGDIVEYAYPDDEVTGTRLAVYFLDPDLPYMAIDGSECRTKKEILTALATSYAEYRQPLQQPNDSFYLYLSARGGKKEADLFRSYFASYSPDIALYHVIYSLAYALNRDVPIIIRGKRESPDQPVLSARNAKELAEVIAGNPEASMSRFYVGEIGVWLSYREPDSAVRIDAIVDEFKDGNKAAGLVLATYVLDPERPFVAPNGTACASKIEIGNAVNADPNGFLPLLKDVDSNLYLWLLSRGLKGEVSHFRAVFTKGQAGGKVSPWNDMITAYKVVVALDATPTFTHEGKRYSSPDELIHADSSTKRSLLPLLSDKNSRLNAWLSVFSYENPVSADGKKLHQVVEDYPGKLKQYFDNLELINGDNELSRRYSKAVRASTARVNKQRRADARFVVERLFAMAAPVLIACGILGVTLLVNDAILPSSVFDLGSSYYFFMAALATVGVFLAMRSEEQEGVSQDFDLSTGCVGGPILGLIVGAIFYFVLKFLFTSPVVLALLLGSISWLAVRSVRKVPAYSDLNLRNQLYSQAGADGVSLEHFRFAFGREKKFSDAQKEMFATYKQQRNVMRWKIWKRSGGVSLMLAAMLYYQVQWSTSPPPSLPVEKKMEPQVVAPVKPAVTPKKAKKKKSRPTTDATVTKQSKSKNQ